MKDDFPEAANGQTDTPAPSRWKRISETTKDDWRQIKKATKIAAQETWKTGKTIVKVAKTRKFKELLTPSFPPAIAAMQVFNIEGGQEFRPHFRPEVDDDLAHNEINGAFKHPHTYGLENFRVIDLHLEKGETTTAWYHPPDPGFPTIVYCHGALGTLYDRKGQLEEFSNRGFGVIMAAYPGMKNNRTPPCGQITIPYMKGQKLITLDPSEPLCIETARAMVLYILNERMGRKEHDSKAKNRLERKGTYLKSPPEEDPMRKIIFFGESLGSAIALQTATMLEKGESAADIQWQALNGRLPLRPYESEEDYVSDINKAHEDIKREHAEFKKMHGDTEIDRGYNESDFELQKSHRLHQGRESLTIPAVICWGACTSLPDKAQEEYPDFNADFWLKNRFDNRKAIAEINYDKTKVLLMHGLEDEYISPAYSKELLKYSGENEATASGHNADSIFLEGCNHGSTFTRESWKQDMSQIHKIGDAAQKYLSDLGLCPEASQQYVQERAEKKKSRSLRVDQADESWAATVHTDHESSVVKN